MSAAPSHLESLEQLLASERQMGLIGAKFLHLAGASYLSTADTPLDMGYGRMAAHECFRNAFELAIAHPELTYCEGRASTGWPVEHAWCVTADGRVVEPTWEAQSAAYRGVCFSTDFLVRWVRETRRLGVLSEIFPRQLLTLDPAEYLSKPSLEQLTAVRGLQRELLHMGREAD